MKLNKKIMGLILVSTISMVTGCSDSSEKQIKYVYVPAEQITEVVEEQQEQVTETTSEQKAVLEKAKSYSENSNLSKIGIYEQLVEWEKFTPEESQYAIDNLVTDYNFNALEKAKGYRENNNLSNEGIYEQLVGWEKFTPEEARYAVDNLN